MLEGGILKVLSPVEYNRNIEYVHIPEICLLVSSPSLLSGHLYIVYTNIIIYIVLQVSVALAPDSIHQVEISGEWR